MKKRVITILLMAVMAVSMASCGKSEDTQADAGKGSTVEVSSQAGQEETKEKKEEKKEEKGEEDLPNWKGVGDHFGYSVYTDDDTCIAEVNINICYPSLKPPSGGWAYQKDPACVLVDILGFDEDDEEIGVNRLEDSFETAKEWLTRDYNVDDINNRYADADFIVETEEQVTINEFSCCKYTGKFTYTYNPLKLNGEPTEERESDFVAYAVDTRQTLKGVEGIYPVLIVVLDDSQGNPSMEPLPEGTIEAYARKMVESIRIGDYAYIVEGETTY